MKINRALIVGYGLSRLPMSAAAAAIAHGLRMGVNLLIIKMIAVYLGPSGLGAIGNLMSVLSFMMVFAGGGIANGITKYVAEYQGRSRSTLRLYETAFALGFAISAMVLVICILAARSISVALFQTTELWWLSIALGFTHFACFLGNATIAIINGRRRADLFAAVSIIAYLGAIPVAYLLVHTFGFSGAALALMTMASCTAVPSLWLLIRSPARLFVRFRLHQPEARKLLRFSVMTFTSAVTFPLAEIIIRTAVIDSLGLTQAGIWQASIRLSGAILGFYTVYLATSYMPRLSALTGKMMINLVLHTLLTVGGVFVVGAVAIYLLRMQIVPLLFSDAFAPLQPLLAWQLLGDLFRVCAYVIGFGVVAKARLGLHVAAEGVQYALYVMITLVVIYSGGTLADVIRAYVLSYGIYFLLALAGLAHFRMRMR